MREADLIPEGLNEGQNISLKRFLRKGYTSKFFDRWLDISVIEANNRWINIGIGRVIGEGLSMNATYTHVENSSGIHMLYSHTL